MHFEKCFFEFQIAASEANRLNSVLNCLSVKSLSSNKFRSRLRKC